MGDQQRWMEGAFEGLEEKGKQRDRLFAVHKEKLTVRIIDQSIDLSV